jgi:GAF domain-containing protein
MLIALHEALVGLLGCDEVAVLERGPDETLGVAACFGLCEATVMPMPEAVLASALAGRRFVGLHDPAAVSRRPMVCVPLRVDERVLGALAVYRLSDRKGGLGDRDWALLDLLAVHIATALVATRPASGPR